MPQGARGLACPGSWRAEGWRGPSLSSCRDARDPEWALAAGQRDDGVLTPFRGARLAAILLLDNPRARRIDAHRHTSVRAEPYEERIPALSPTAPGFARRGRSPCGPPGTAPAAGRPAGLPRHSGVRNG